MTRDDIKAKFLAVEEMFRKYRLPRLADLPGIPPGQARAEVHGLGQPDPEPQGLGKVPAYLITDTHHDPVRTS